MKYLLLTILILLKAFSSLGQDIEQIIISSQEADEPPTKQGRPEYLITFEKKKQQKIL